MATISRLLKMIGLFCRILSLLWVSFAKETYHLKEPTNRSHPILWKALISCQNLELFTTIHIYSCELLLFTKFPVETISSLDER